MQINIITIFPQMFQNVFDYGIIFQGIKKGILEINVHDLRNWAKDKHKRVDNRPFGGGVGMILMVEPLFLVIEEITNNSQSKPYVIYTSPQGSLLNQQKAEQLSNHDNIIIICGRYEGIDQRVIDNLVDEEISIGDYVLSGGEFPAMVIVDAITRLKPDVIKNSEFNKNESFSDPNDRSLLDFPQYTRPEDFRGNKVPEVLLSGNHKKIEEWRNQNRKKKFPN
jgi:tRNA (guanine37-N1)-methyltransferase